MSFANSSYVNAGNIKLEPMELYFGLRNKDCFTVTTASLDGLYFDFNTIDFNEVETEYRAWYDLDDGSTPPAAAGKTLIEIDIITGDSTASVATKTVADLAIGAPGAAYRASGSLFTITQKNMGAITAVSVGTSTFTVASIAVGIKEGLGGTDGPVELSLTRETVPLNADQEGAVVLGELISSVGAEISVTLLEMTADKWQTIIGNVQGQSFTPAGGSKIIGVGSNSISKNLLSLGRELLLKPVGSLNNLRNHTFFKCAPNPGSISFSGTETSKMAVTFGAYLDSSKNRNLNLYAFGDSHQDVEL